MAARRRYNKTVMNKLKKKTMFPKYTLSASFYCSFTSKQKSHANIISSQSSKLRHLCDETAHEDLMYRVHLHMVVHGHSICTNCDKLYRPCLCKTN